MERVEGFLVTLDDPASRNEGKFELVLVEPDHRLAPVRRQTEIEAGAREKITKMKRHPTSGPPRSCLEGLPLESPSGKSANGRGSPGSLAILDPRRGPR